MSEQFHDAYDEPRTHRAPRRRVRDCFSPMLDLSFERSLFPSVFTPPGTAGPEPAGP